MKGRPNFMISLGSFSSSIFHNLKAFSIFASERWAYAFKLTFSLFVRKVNAFTAGAKNFLIEWFSGFS